MQQSMQAYQQPSYYQGGTPLTNATQLAPGTVPVQRGQGSFTVGGQSYVPQATQAFAGGAGLQYQQAHAALGQQPGASGGIPLSAYMQGPGYGVLGSQQGYPGAQPVVGGTAAVTPQLNTPGNQLGGFSAGFGGVPAQANGQSALPPWVSGNTASLAYGQQLYNAGATNPNAVAPGLNTLAPAQSHMGVGQGLQRWGQAPELLGGRAPLAPTGQQAQIPGVNVPQGLNALAGYNPMWTSLANQPGQSFAGNPGAQAVNDYNPMAQVGRGGAPSRQMAVSPFNGALSYSPARPINAAGTLQFQR